MTLMTLIMRKGDEGKAPSTEGHLSGRAKTDDSELLGENSP